MTVDCCILQRRYSGGSMVTIHHPPPLKGFLKACSISSIKVFVISISKRNCDVKYDNVLLNFQGLHKIEYNKVKKDTNIMKKRSALPVFRK